MRVPHLFIILTAAILVLLPARYIHAQSDTIKQAREAVTENVTEAARAEATRAPEAERFATKRAALESILSLSKLEAEELQAKLTALLLNNEIEKVQALRTKFAAALDSYLAYLKNADDTLATTPELTAIENIAGDLQEWKETIYNPEMQKILDFTLAFQNRQMLLVGDARLTRVATEIKRAKLSREKAVAAKLLLNAASNHLKTAHALNEDAITAVRAYLAPNENRNTDAIQEDALLPTPETTPLTTPSVENDKNSLILPAPTPRELVTNSVKEIRATYENFLKIAELLNKKTGK